MTKSRHTIVLTGAPASGKTEILGYLKTLKPLTGFAFLEELARKLLESDPDYRKNWHQLHIDIYHRQTKREEELDQRSFVTDRGTIDAFAFHPETAEAVKTTINREYGRYSLVIHLGSSAILGDRFYRTDAVRHESIKKALEIEAAIKRAWKDHPNYHFIEAEPEITAKRKKVVALIGQYTDLL